MKIKKKLTRRDFITQSTLASAALITPGFLAAGQLSMHSKSLDDPLLVYIFSKHLQFLNYKDMCEAAREMGFDGIDLTVRPKGHVTPSNVTTALPLATEYMKEYELSPKMIATNITDANDPVQKQVLTTASQLGYKNYRTGWFRYSTDRKITEVLDEAKTKLSALSNLNRELKIKGGYHNHSRHFFGSAIWDLHQTIEDLSPQYIGSQYDIMHATVEGGRNWEIGFRLIKPFINSIVIKDFKWKEVNGSWMPSHMPVGEGMVNLNRFFQLLKKNHIRVPVSLHVEYDLGGAEHGGKPSIPHKEVFKRIKKDLDYIRNVWASI